MNIDFNSAHPRGPDGKFVTKARINACKNLYGKTVEHWTKSGSKNPDKYKGLNKEQIAIVDSFEEMNSSRKLNDISAKINNGSKWAEVVSEYGQESADKYNRVKTYMDVTPKYKGHITRLLRDDHDVFGKYNVGDEMHFDRLTSFGEYGNSFEIRGGNLTIHIPKSTRGTSIKNIMSFKEEEEVLIDAGKYRVTQKTEGNIFLEEI